MKLLANKVFIQGIEVLLADKVHKQEPQRVSGMADATLFYCYVGIWLHV